ncbi:MAG: hypothetical protein DRJ97_03265 [Thermoprotei archaeon]|nr:MAG: hypothetical protein DRJ97_03265 [Thermoprotei archaeon]
MLGEAVSEEEIYRVYQALGNPQRRKIIYLLGSRGPLPFSELKKSLNISVGSLYYNLDQLRDLVFQGPDKRYALTSKGMAVYNLLRREDDILEPVTSSSSLPSWAWRVFSLIRQAFFPRELLSIFYAQRGVRVALSVIAVMLGVLVCSFTGTDVFLTYIRTGFKGTLSIPELSLYLHMDPMLLAALTFIATWLVLSLIPYAVVSALKWEWCWDKLVRFLEGSALSTLPLTVYVAVHNAVVSSGAVGYAVFLALGAFFALSWALMVGFIAACLSIVKRISGSRALIIMVVVAYLCLMAQQAIIVKWFVTP